MGKEYKYEMINDNITNEKSKILAKTFCNTYFDCWIKAMNDDGCHKYKGIKDLDVSEEKPNGALKRWTDFHMKKILYVLAEELNNGKYKTQKCSNDKCAYCDHYTKKTREYKCGYSASWQQEYYKVDLLLSEYNCAGDWCNDFYIEHENAPLTLKKVYKDSEENTGEFKVNRSGWFDEFNKLLPLKTSENGMRVIIAYDDFDMVEEKKRYLLDRQLNNKYSTVQKSIVECPILVILAPSNKAIKSSEDKRRFYILLFSYNENTSEWESSHYRIIDQDIKDIFDKIRTC